LTRQSTRGVQITKDRTDGVFSCTHTFTPLPKTILLQFRTSWLNDTKRKKKTKPPFSAFILRKAEWSPGRTQEEEEGTKESEKARI
jgi:hypothetical protein